MNSVYRMINTGPRVRNLMPALFCSCILLLPARASAQLTARAMGMGGAYTSLARGVHAMDWNPANLGLPDNPRFSLTFLAVGTAVNNNAFTRDMYDRYLVRGADADNNIYWSEKDIEDLLNAVPDDGLNVTVQTEVRAFAFSIGRFAFSFAADAASSVSLDKTMLQLPLTGTRIDKEYTFSDTDGRGLGYGAVAVSWGQPVPVRFFEHFSLGATLRAFYGGGYFRTNHFDMTVALKDYGADLNGSYDVVYAYNSQQVGWGMDLGAAAFISSKWAVSLSAANVIGSIPWRYEVRQEKGLISADSVSVFTDFDTDIADTSWTVDPVSFSSRVPPVLKLGVMYQERTMVITADYCQGFSEGAFVSTRPRFSLGTEWRGLSWLPLRAGVMMGGRTGFGTSLGFGIRPGGFRFDVAVMNRGGITPAGSKGVSVAFDLGLDLSPRRDR